MTVTNDPVETSAPGAPKSGEYTASHALMANAPYVAMLALGAAVLVVVDSMRMWGILAGVAYVLYGLVGVVWIMWFVCPHCAFHNTRSCPCGYGLPAARLRPRQDGSCFATQFRRHIPVIVPLWLAPPIIAGLRLVTDFEWLLMVLLATFVVNSFLILPLLSMRHGCATCPQLQDCPWMMR